MNQLKSVILLDWFSQNKKEQQNTAQWDECMWSIVMCLLYTFWMGKGHHVFATASIVI